MTKRHCFVTQVGDAIEALASALDPEREPPFKGDILDLLEWAEKDVLEMRQQIAERDAELKRINLALNDDRVDLTITAAEAITELRQQLASRDVEVKLLLEALHEYKWNKNEWVFIIRVMEIIEALAVKG